MLNYKTCLKLKEAGFPTPHPNELQGKMEAFKAKAKQEAYEDVMEFVANLDCFDQRDDVSTAIEYKFLTKPTDD